MCVEQHRDVLVSCFQSDGQSVTLILDRRKQEVDKDNETKRRRRNKSD